jgi:hypothetical protein
MLVDARMNGIVAGSDPFPYSMSIDDVEAWLGG